MSLCKYLCIMLYLKLMSCSGLPCIYGWLEEGGQSVMKLIWCSGLPWICGQLEERNGVSLVMKIMQCNGLLGIHVQLTGGSISVAVCHVSVVDWRRWGAVSLSWKLGSVMIFQISMLDWGWYIWSHCALHLTSSPTWTLHLQTWPNSMTILNGLSLQT